MTTYFVDNDAANNGNGLSEASPFNSTAALWGVMAGGGVDEAVIWGTDTEPMVPPISVSGADEANKTVFRKHPTMRWRLDGGQMVTGWTPAPAARDALLGPNRSQFWEVVIPKSIFPDTDFRALNLHEADIQRPISAQMLAREDDFFVSRVLNYPVSDDILFEPFAEPDFSQSEVLTESVSRKVTIPADWVTLGQSYTVGKNRNVGSEYSTGEVILLTYTRNEFPYTPSADPSTGAGLNALIEEGWTMERKRVRGFRLPAAQYMNATELQVLNSFGHFVRNPNNPASSAIESYDPITRIAIFVDKTQDWQYTEIGRGISLRNYFPAAQQGDWGFEDLDPGNDNGNLRIYLWPTDPLNLTSDIRIAKNNEGIDINGVSNLLFQGVEIQGQSPSSKSEGAIYISEGSPNITFEDCTISGVYINRGFTSTGAIQYADAAVKTKADNTKFDGCTFSRISGVGAGHAIFAQGDGANLANSGQAASVDTIKEFTVIDCVFEWIYSAAVRCFTVHSPVVAHSTLMGVGKAAHANLINFYQGCYNVLVYGVNTLLAGGGYMPWQETDSVVIAFCAGFGSTASSGGNRFIYSQQNSTPTQGSVESGGYLGSMTYNNTSLPLPYRLNNTHVNALKGGSDNRPEDRWRHFNNVYYGHQAEDFAQVDDMQGNLDISMTGGNYTPYPAAFAANNHKADPLTEFVDPANGDFTYSPGAVIRTLTGYDMSAITPSLALRWRHFNRWNEDMNRQPVNWASAPVGCTVDLEYDKAGAPQVGPPDEPEPEYPEVAATANLRIQVAA